MMQSALEPLEVLLIERACERLSIDYVRRVDAREESFADLFTEDAHLVLFGFELFGRQQILDFVRNLSSEHVTLHLSGNIAIDVINAEEARGASEMMYYNAPAVDGIGALKTLAPLAIGTYQDVFQKTPAGWRIATRRFQENFLNAAVAKNAAQKD